MNMSPETLNVGDTVSVQLTLQKLKPSLAATQSLLLGTLRYARMRIIMKNTDNKSHCFEKSLFPVFH